MGRNRMHMKKIGTFDIVIMVVMAVLCFVTLYPIWYTIVLSFNDATDALRGGIYWWPREFSLASYEAVFQDSAIVRSYIITIMRTLIGTLTSVFFTSMVAYAFSKSRIMGNKIYLGLGTVTMFFSGGLIPYFIWMRQLGLYNSFLMYIIPSLFSFYNAIIFMTFFRDMPVSLEESAKLDGCNDFRIFVQIILPLSGPILATIALFNGVGHWNDYFTGVMYIDDQSLQPVQTYLYRIIASASASRSAVASSSISAGQYSSTSLKLATMVITTAPIVCIYPFLQRYFVKGIMIGSIKG